MQSFIGKVLEKEDLTPDVIRFTITSPTGFSFKAGQFVNLMIKKDGVRKPRSYSILDSSSDGERFHLVIKLIENGFASKVFKETKVGDEFEVKGPLGHFIFDEKSENKENWFIGCSCGLVPLYSMITANLEKFPGKKFYLVFSVKTKKDLILHDELRKMEQNNANFIYIPTLTREEWEGKSGRVQKHFPNNLKNKTFYICGIKELVIDVKEYLLDNGVDSKNIKFERYS
ncbi:MAG: FAD-dependent oxidoreductase [Nanoarchaeota archaeon]|nr:FAD-dependent oxidoreductase [Nanoarchaeota archaeon]